jgi:hypothetical protein
MVWCPLWGREDRLELADFAKDLAEFVKVGRESTDGIAYDIWQWDMPLRT